MHTKKSGRYNRLYEQIKDLVKATENPVTRMATIAALLHHKMNGYFWTGFYFLEKGELIVGPYQGPIACLKLKKDTGVCWAGINRKESVVVGDVHQFPGHIACSSQSNSEIVVPVKDEAGRVVAVLDVDSRDLNCFDEEDRVGLEKIVELVYNH
ncbi:GAF domain-containing protein [Geofilum rubicundum]|uniref:GAF domain-containing proteins n=1 Tax=Geofilum rubicundum JCM 15548 TaxID=1236989 RepID=A0A0E9LY96_9BACT|nr:GAF domain-containing protein [Geofilum rubicundum]GAO30273.1 GAF domain-containing proteins [Geofilum rubicundum JCM 15548]